MGGAKILLLFIIFMNNIGGTNGSGEENDNDLFGEMWRKALASNSHNLAQLNSDQKKEEKPKELKIEEQNEEDDDQKMGKSENKLKRNIKTEPIFDQTEGKDSDQKNRKKVKKEPKIEENTLEDLREKWHKDTDRNDTPNAQKESDQSNDQNNKTESEEKKLAIVNEFERMRKELKRKNKGQDDTKIAREIAKKLGESLKEIYKWRKEIRTKKCQNYEKKLKIIKEFDKMKKEKKNENGKQNQNRSKIEREIARELGTCRNEIYRWKKEIGKKDGVPTIENAVKMSIINKYEKMRKANKLKSDHTSKDRAKSELEIAKELGINRNRICKWKRELGYSYKLEIAKTNLKLIEKFDEMIKEFKNIHKRKDRMKKEREIANELGTYRHKIYEWKKELRNKKVHENEEKKSEIIKSFDKMRKDYWDKNGDRLKIERKIAKELGTNRHKIYEWKNESFQKKDQQKIEKRKREIIKSFDKMRKDYWDKNGDRLKIEREIANELGTNRHKIYEWKKEFNKEDDRVPTEKENAAKISLIRKFDKLKKEYKIKNNFKRKDRNKIEKEIAKEMGTNRHKIYEWKKEFNKEDDRVPTEKENAAKMSLIKKFDKLKKEHKIKNNSKRKDRNKIEREIAKEMGTSREKIYKWKKELSPPMEYTKEQKREIIDQFDKLREEFSNKFNVKMNAEIEEKIARKFGVCLRTISNWRSN